MLERIYIKYYISGYLNMYFSDVVFAFDSTKESFQQYRLRSVLRYLGLSDTKVNFAWLAPVLSLIEAIAATLLVLIRGVLVLLKCLFVKNNTFREKTFMASLTFAAFRLKGILDSIRPVEVSTLKIPFIKSEYHENEVDVLSGISYNDVLKSIVSSWLTIWTMYFKYHKRDPLFRSYSSFEYYLTCCFVNNVKDNNRFVYYNTYDRWAFLMCNTEGSTFIQHGKLMDTLKFIKVGTPHTAFYLSKRQKEILDKILFRSTPQDVRYKKNISFTCNELLLHNEKKNVLLVCWVNNIEKEWKICQLLNNKVNLFIKPHPGDKDNPEYPNMANKYNCVIVPKTGYPQVDVVISYDSTLADEYEDVGVKVIRYDLLDNLDDILKFV